MTERTSVNGTPASADRPVIRLFGPLPIENGRHTIGPGDLGGVRPKQVLERGHRVPTDRLAELVWGSERPKDVAGSLQTFGFVVEGVERALWRNVEGERLAGIGLPDLEPTRHA